MALEPDDLRSLDRLLDEALELDPHERVAWLDRLPPELDRLAPTLRELLLRNATFTTAGLLERRAADDLAAGLLASSANRALAAGTQIGPYRLTRELGAGGMGVVWLAERADGLIDRPIALKLPLFSAHNRSLTQRFARERVILGRLEHPHIARLYDAGISETGQPYLAMEYVQGQPLTQWCDDRKAGVPERLAVVVQVLRAIQHAHDRDIVHRDLKPSNILVMSDGEVRLLDFGIAKLLSDGEGAESEATRVGGRALTPSYAAPELISGAPAGISSDLYSIGVILYELLTGRRPYRETANDIELHLAILHDEPARPSAMASDEAAERRALRSKRQLAARLAGDLDTIVLKLLKKRPQERYAAAADVADDLERHLDGRAIAARADSHWYRAARFARRHRTALLVSAMSAIAVVAAGWTAQYLLEERVRDLTDRGRKELLAGNQARAAVYLSKSYSLGNDDEGLRFMLWQAMRDVEKLAATLRWPGAEVRQASFSPDGSLLAVGLFESKTRQSRMLVLDAHTLEQISSFAVTGELHEWPVFDARGSALVAVGADWVAAWEPRSGSSMWKVSIPKQRRGDRVRRSVTGDNVAIGIAGKVLSFDLRSGRLRAELATEVPFFEMLGAPDGSKLLVVEGMEYSANGLGRRAWLWDMKDGTRLALPGSEAKYSGFSFAPDSRQVALARDDGTIDVLEAKSGMQSARIRQPSRVSAMVWALDSRILFAGTSSGVIYGWNARTGDLAGTLIGHAGSVLLLRVVSPDRLLSGSSDGTLRIWDSALSWPLAVFDAQTFPGRGQSISASAAADRVLSADDSSVRLWDMTKVSPRSRFGVGLGPMEAAVSDTARRIAISAANSAAELWDFARGIRIATLSADERVFRVSADGSRLLTGFAVRSLDDGRILLDFDTRPFRAQELIFAEWSYEAGTVAAFANKRLRVFDLANGKLKADFDVQEPGYPVAVSRDGRLVGLGVADGIRLFDVAAGEAIGRYPVPSQRGDPQFLHDSRRVLAIGARKVRILDASSGRTLDSYTNESRDSQWVQHPFCKGRYLMVYAYSKNAHVISLDTGQLVQTLRGPAAIPPLDCDSSGRFVAAGGNDGFTRIWSLSDGAMIAQFRSHLESTASAHFIDGDRALVTSGMDRTVAVWQLGRETRSAADVARIVACQAPWHLEGRELVPGAAAVEGCPGR